MVICPLPRVASIGSLEIHGFKVFKLLTWKMAGYFVIILHGVAMVWIGVPQKVFSILLVYIFYRWQCSVWGIHKPQNLILLTVSGWGKLWKHAQTSALKICGLLHNPQPKTMWCLINPSNLLLHSPRPTQSSGRRFQIFCPKFDSMNLGDNVENVPNIYYIYIIYRNKVRAEVATTVTELMIASSMGRSGKKTTRDPCSKQISYMFHVSQNVIKYHRHVPYVFIYCTMLIVPLHPTILHKNMDNTKDVPAKSW